MSEQPREMKASWISFGMQRVGTLASLAAGAPDERNRVNDLLDDDGLVPVRASQMENKRCAASVRNKMALRSRFRAIRWIRSGRCSLVLASMLALSRQIRSQPAAGACCGPRVGWSCCSPVQYRGNDAIFILHEENTL